MNKLSKNGFSLVELVGVIAILGLVMVIVATNGLGAFEGAKSKLKEEDEKTIIEAAKVLMTDVLYCDEKINADLLENDNTTDFAYINGFTSGTINCTHLLNKSEGEGLTIPLDYLIDNKFVTGNEIIKMKGKGITYTGSIVNKTDIKIVKN